MRSPPSGPLPLVFLHGWLSDGADWREVAGAIDDVPTSCPDLQPAADWPTAIAALVASLPPCVLVGYSMGGRVALAAAVAPGSPVRGLVVVSANPGLTSARDREARAASDQRLCDDLLNGPRDAFLDAWFRQPLFRTVGEAMRSRWIDERRTLDLERQRALSTCYGIAGQPDLWPALPSLAIPTLLLTGAADAKYAAIQAVMASQIPDTESVILAGASHAPHREQPGVVRSHIESWYRRRMRSPAPSADDEPRTVPDHSCPTPTSQKARHAP